ncbi:MAG: hypothetical protein OK452_10160 [Thaumarchaeota archaeon]|nr:hypothetical protein [Nitrososphaerota archaeon]
MASRTILLAAVLVIGLLVGFGASYLYAQNQITSLQNSLTQANQSISTLHSQTGNTSKVLALSPHPGAMIHTGWVVIAPVGSGDYAIVVHAEGLEPPSLGGYIVEGAQRTTAMNVVPIGANATASEFDAGTDGVGNYWTVIMQNPTTSFESIELLYLPGMNMAQATLVASVSLG